MYLNYSSTLAVLNIKSQNHLFFLKRGIYYTSLIERYIFICNMTIHFIHPPLSIQDKYSKSAQNETLKSFYCQGEK